VQRLPGAAHVRAQVQIREDQRVIDLSGHMLILDGSCYWVMNLGQIGSESNR
jgi:hypothetical protein